MTKSTYDDKKEIVRLNTEEYYDCELIATYGSSFVSMNNILNGLNVTITKDVEVLNDIVYGIVPKVTENTLNKATNQFLNIPAYASGTVTALKQFKGTNEQ